MPATASTTHSYKLFSIFPGLADNCALECIVLSSLHPSEINLS